MLKKAEINEIELRYDHGIAERVGFRLRLARYIFALFAVASAFFLFSYFGLNFLATSIWATCMLVLLDCCVRGFLLNENKLNQYKEILCVQLSHPGTIEIRKNKIVAYKKADGTSYKLKRIESRLCNQAVQPFIDKLQKIQSGEIEATDPETAVSEKSLAEILPATSRRGQRDEADTRQISAADSEEFYADVETRLEYISQVEDELIQRLNALTLREAQLEQREVEVRWKASNG